MYAGIGTSCPDHLGLLSQQGGECLLKRLLHTDAVGLNLPAVITGTVERKRYEVSHTRFACKVTSKREKNKINRNLFYLPSESKLETLSQSYE